MNDSGALVFGAGSTAGIVAVEPAISAGTATYYIRDGATVRRQVVPLRAWVLMRKAQRDSRELAGRHPLRHLVETSDGRAALELAQNTASDQRLAYLDPITAHLVASGETLFRGMRFEALRRLQFDLETLDVYPERYDAAICLIGVTDSAGYERVLALDEFPSEAAMIAEFVRVVRERDPDVIEGHNVFNFDLWYLHERAKRLGVNLALGRDERIPLWHDESLRRVAPGGVGARYYRIEGRQVIDTFLGAMRWDVGRRLPNYKLKHIVSVLGIGDADRALVDASRMRELWSDPRSRAHLKAYCLADAQDTQRLSKLVTPNEFYQAQLVPESLQGLAFVGTGSRIERLLVRAYLRDSASIPRPRPAAPIEGALTAAFETGVFFDVIKCDVESLYPSLMLARHIAPTDDDLGVFLPMLETLRDMRLRTKREATEAARAGDAAAHLAADGLQNAFKILINSFYGFLGTNGLHFNDPEAAARVTEAGREMLDAIVDGLRAEGCRVIEADTDGAFFTAPSNSDPESIVARVGAKLPAGVRLAVEERYPAMLSLKAKTYALRRSGGDLLLRGSALRSARNEPFGRRLMHDIAAALMDGRDDQIAADVRETARRIAAGELTIEDFARRESVTSKTFSAAGNRRLAAALAERGLAVGDKVRVYQRAGGELALAEDYGGDEDRQYLLRRLSDFVARFGETVPPDARTAANADPDQLPLL